jgi:hypothetical protein
VLPPSEMLVSIHQTTRRYIPEGRDLDIYPLTAGDGRDTASSKRYNNNTGADVTTLKSDRKRCRGPRLFVRVSTLTRPKRYF